MRRCVELGWILALAGCGEWHSTLEPEAPLEDLRPHAVTRLCRFTSDILGDADVACAPPNARDFDACLDDPPWDDCAPDAGEAPYDVGSWEDCVNALDRAVCDSESQARCPHLRCL